MEKVLLLTGATGLLGSNLIPRLLNADQSLRIVALVRGDSQGEAQRRLHSLLRSVSPAISPDDVAQRITAVQGDITKINIGLSDACYIDLTRTVTHIVHAAANVEFQLPIETARAINFSGTKNLVRLARSAMSSGNLQRFAYVSTAYVAGKRPGRVFEDELSCGQSFANTYEQSKFECECHVRELMDELPITVFRPSIIVGDSHSGQTSTFKVLYFPLRLIHRGILRILPGSRHTPTDVVPVDYVCDALCRIFLNSIDCSGKTFHLTAGEDNASTAGEVIDLSVDYFNDIRPSNRIRRIKFIPLQIYRAAEKVMSGNAKKAGQLMSVYESYLTIQRSFNDSNTRSALKGTMITPPSFRAYYQAILKYYVESNWGRQYRLAA